MNSENTMEPFLDKTGRNFGQLNMPHAATLISKTDR